MPYYPPGPVLATVATNSVTTDDQTFALDAGTQVIFEQSDGDDILVLTESNGGILHKFHSAFGAGAEIDFSPFFAFAFYPVVLIEETVTLANTGEVAGIADYLIVNPSVDTADYCIAADIEVYSQTGNVNDIGGLIGVYGEARHQGSGVVPTLAGLYYFSTNNSSGPVTAQFGAYLDVKNPGSGVVTLKEGLHIATMTAGGVVTVQRGINVAPVSGAATNYAIQTAAGHVVFNEDSHDDTDFRVEGATDTHLLFTDGSANFVGIGTSAPSNKFHTLLSDAVTAAITNVGRLSHNSTGTAAAGFGPGLIFGGKSSTTNDQDMGRLTYEWSTATHASRASRGKLTAYNVATEVECIRWDASGAVTIPGDTTIDVATDIIPLTLEKSASQTANIFQTRQAAAANLLTHIKNNGQMEVIFDANVAPGFQVRRLASTIYLSIGGNNVGSYVNGENVNASGGAIWTIQGTAARNGSAGSNVSGLLVNPTMAPTSGSSEHYGVRLAPTINQTVATGDVTIFSVAPTLTAVVGTLRYFEFMDGANRVFEIGRRGNVKVNQVNTTAAVPSLWLNQADLSEEFIRFESTVGGGNPIDTAALGAYYGKVRVYVEGVGAKWLALYD